MQGTGVFTDSRFKTAQWRSIQEGFEKCTGLTYDKQQLQNQFAGPVRNYGVYSALKENSGLGWNDELKIPTAPSSVWDDYIAAHPVAKVYIYTTLSNFEELETLFCGRVATGKFAQSSAIAAAQYAITASSSPSTSVSGPSSKRKFYRYDSPQLSYYFCVYSDDDYDNTPNVPAPLGKSRKWTLRWNCFHPSPA